MGEHFKALSAVFPIILRTFDTSQQVLLHKRANTGYMDGLWDFAGSGHVDADETAMQALIRECKEEIGITVAPKNLRFAHLAHRVGQNGARTYYDIYFIVDLFSGQPSIKEADKCADLQWFDINSLPEDMIELRKEALALCLNSVLYSEVVYN